MPREGTGGAAAALARAAAPCYERIRRDRRVVPRGLRLVFDRLLEELFDPELTVRSLFESCGLKDHSTAIRFRSATGETPYAYFQELRLETSSRLLTQTGLPVSRIAELVGYWNIQVFSRSFARHFTVRPSVFRLRARDGEALERLDVGTLRRALRGELEEEGAVGLMARLASLYPRAIEVARSSLAES